MPTSNFLALDVGEVRVGVAKAHHDVKVPVVVTTLQRQADDFWQQLLQLIKQENVGQLVIGLPRGMQGQETAQTAVVEAFGKELEQQTLVPIAWQDEALTSQKAEQTLKQSGKPYEKADVDALAACYILSDYLETGRVGA